MKSIGPVTNYPDQGSYQLDDNLLLINHAQQFYCIENKCGHFGEPLARSKIKDKKIVCPMHYISFNLENGQVEDSLGEDCDPIRVFEVIEENGILYCK